MNQILKSISFTVFSLSIIFNATAQFSETIFYDTLTKVSTDGYLSSAFTDGKHIYLSGRSFSDIDPVPTVTKLDTAGNVIWTAVDHHNPERFLDYGSGLGTSYQNTMSLCRGTIKSGTALYTIMHSRRLVTTTNGHEIWSISDSSGALLWKTDLKRYIQKIADYSSTELLVITGTYQLEYHIINKLTGALVFTKYFGTLGTSLSNVPNIFIDDNRNVLLSWSDTCRKFRDNRLTQTLWTSHIPNNGKLKMIDIVTQDSGRYIFMGRSNVRCVDTLTGNTVWFREVPVGYIVGVQGGDFANPKDFILQDSLLYVTWVLPTTGTIAMKRSFTLTAINKYTGNIRYNVAHDFTGIPADIFNGSEIDWPMKMCMDNNKNIYMTGSYDEDGGIESPANWGIMKINYETGSKIYEATITEDSTRRSMFSQGKFICYINGKMYCAGNLKKKNISYANPLFLSFDTANVYKENFRMSPFFTIRYPSALTGLSPVSLSKMVLLKKVGRSGVIELRSTGNQLLWSSTFSSSNKFMVPQNIKNLGDTAITASFILYQQNPANKMLQGQPDSLVFVKLDTLGNINFRHSIKYKDTDTLTAVQIYSDKFGKTNFIFRSKRGSIASDWGYTLNGTATSLSQLTDSKDIDTDTVVIRTNPAQHYNGDSLVIYYTGNVLGSWARFYSAGQLTANYPAFYGFKRLKNFARIYSALKLDSVSFLIMGRDSSGFIRADRYNHRLGSPMVWSYTLPIPGTMYNADSSATSVYAVSKNNNTGTLVLSKFNRQTGVPNWNIEKTRQAKTAILPTDFKHDPTNNYFITGGYITDSSVSGVKSSYFYTTLDSTGKIVKDVIRPGYGILETKINVVNVLKNGTHVYGGALGTIDLGIVGFYNSDCYGNNLVPSVSIKADTTTICTNTPVTFTATTLNGGNNPVYQWQVNGINAGTNANTFTTSTLKNNDQVKVTITSNSSCLQIATATSNVISITVNTQQAPSVLISGNTTVNQGQSSLITATPSNGGNNPAFLWQDSTKTHSWQNISGQASNTINYIPALTGDKIRCVLTGVATCVSQIPVTSNVLTFTVKDTGTTINPGGSGFGIISYPNPVHTSFTLDSLRLSDKWLTLDIITIDGKQPIPTIDISNQIKITVNVQSLTKGIFTVVLRRKEGSPLYIMMVKL